MNPDTVKPADSQFLYQLPKALKLQDTYVNWVALGDSYTAGPGLTGGAFDDDPECLRNYHAYATQLSFKFPWDNVGNSFRFLACTGYTTVQT